jgi:hypothetical protein
MLPVDFFKLVVCPFVFLLLVRKVFAGNQLTGMES